MRFIFVLLLAFTFTPFSSLAYYQNRTVIDVYQEAIQKLDGEYQKLKQITADARQKVADLEEETNSVKTLIAKYEAALNTTKQELVMKHEAQLKTVKEAYQKKLAGESDLAEMARQSAEDDAKTTRALLDKLGTAAEKVAKLTDAVSVSSDGKVGIGTTNPQTKLDVKGSIKANNHLTHLPWHNLRTAPQGPWVPGYMKLKTPIVHNEGNMFSIKIKGYRYGTGGTPVDIRCGGYAYTGSTLISSACHTEGTSDPVGIGLEDGKVIITIGSGGGKWYFDHFTAEYSGWKAKKSSDFVWEFVYNTPPTTTNQNNVLIHDYNGTITTTGNVGIATTTPQYKLDVAGTIRGNNVSPSDQRHKQDIHTLEKALTKLQGLRGVRFKWKDNAQGTDTQIGLIAQEVEKGLPELVSTDSEGYKSIAYGKLTAVLVEAIKELQQQNETMAKKIEALSTSQP